MHNEQELFIPGKQIESILKVKQSIYFITLVEWRRKIISHMVFSADVEMTLTNVNNHS